MWLFTIYGFFSVVMYKPGIITVRARRRKHLNSLAKRFKTVFTFIEHTPTRDYPYRMTCGANAWSYVAGELAKDITYPNFKEAARKHAPHDQEYKDLLHDVWYRAARGAPSERPSRPSPNFELHLRRAMDNLDADGSDW